MILNFLAIEGRITNEHIDSIWAAGQVGSLHLRSFTSSHLKPESIEIKIHLTRTLFSIIGDTGP